MTFYVVHDEDGKAVSMGTVVADPLPNGLTAKHYTARPEGIWDAETLDFVPAPEPEKTYTQLAFMRRFTQQERIGIRASEDAIVQDFLALLQVAQDVSNEDPDTIGAVQYMESLGLIATGRASEVLS